MKNYIITGISINNDRDKALYKLICKLTGAKWRGGEEIYFPSYNKLNLFIKEIVDPEGIHRLQLFCGTKTDYSEFSYEGFSYKKIYYRDFLKQHKVTTKQLLGLDE